MKLNRKDFFKLSGLGMAAAATGGVALPRTGLEAQSMLGRASGPRVVVAGGGWGGVTVAKYLKRNNRNIDVVLIDQRSQFMSCPISNEWLVDNFPLDFLSHDYGQPAERYGFTFINEQITGISTSFRRRVTTTGGYVDYDYLVVAPGIAYDYSNFTGGDHELANACRTLYPAAYMPGNELLSLKRKIHNFEGGDFVMTVPEGPYRCPPAPYERACLIAALFKKNRINGNVIVLDPKPDVAPKGPGFKAAFEQLYRTQIQYVPNAKVESVDPHNKVVKTSAGEFHFDDANLAPKQKAGALVGMAGGLDSSTGWAKAELLTQRISDRIFVVGDALGGTPYPKSGHMANSQGKIIANIIAAEVAGRQLTWGQGLTLPDNTCYSVVNPNPREAIVINVNYDWNAEERRIVPQARTENQRSRQLGNLTTEWAQGIFRDLFS